MSSNDGKWQLCALEPHDAAQRELWRTLAATGECSLVQMPEFVFTCAAVLGRRNLCLAVKRRAGAPCAAAIVDLQRRWLPDVFVEPQMPLGAWVQAPGEDFSALARELTRALGLTIRLGVWQIDPRFVARPASDPVHATLDYIETAWVPIKGSFNDYWAARGKNLRTNMRRQREKLADQGIATRMEVLTAVQDMERAVREYGVLETAGWKSREGTAVSEDHPQAEFYRQMMTAFAERGEARAYRYFFGERLVATELCLCDSKELVILKTTFDETTAPLSPASLLRQEMFSGLFSEGLDRRVEFYGPMKDWHTRWTDKHRVIFHANFFRTESVRAVVDGVRRWRRAAPAPLRS